jgi:hypothetical protein
MLRFTPEKSGETLRKDEHLDGVYIDELVLNSIFDQFCGIL